MCYDKGVLHISENVVGVSCIHEMMLLNILHMSKAIIPGVLLHMLDDVIGCDA